MTDSDIIAELPEVLRRVAEERGLGAALTLAREYGGREIYVPERLGRDHQLARAIGFTTAQALQRLYGKGRLLIPLGPASSDRKVRERINQLISEHRSVSAIAQETGKHMRTVYRVKERVRARDRQTDLFSQESKRR